MYSILIIGILTLFGRALGRPNGAFLRSDRKSRLPLLQPTWRQLKIVIKSNYSIKVFIIMFIEFASLTYINKSWAKKL